MWKFYEVLQFLELDFLDPDVLETTRHVTSEPNATTPLGLQASTSSDVHLRK